MTSVLRISWLLVFTCCMGVGISNVAHGQAICLQYCIYVEPGVYYLWVADQYDSGYPVCTGGPSEVWWETSSSFATPQICNTNGCLTGGLSRVAAPGGGDHGLSNPVAVGHQFDDTIPLKSEPDATGAFTKPRDGTTVQSEQWLKVGTSADSSIFVKLYVVEIDMKAAGVSEQALKKVQRNRVVRIGFQTEGIPEGETFKEIPFDSLKPWGERKKAFIVKPTSGAEPFTVITATPVFE